MATFQKKLNISIGSAILFVLVNLPKTYHFTNKHIPYSLYNSAIKCPTSLGLIIHTLIFGIVTYYSMKNATIDNGIKLKHTIYGALIFFFISNPAFFSVTQSIFGTNISSTNGCPTLNGIMVHAVLYCMALVAVMYLPVGDGSHK